MKAFPDCTGAVIGLSFFVWMTCNFPFFLPVFLGEEILDGTRAGSNRSCYVMPWEIESVGTGSDEVVHTPVFWYRVTFLHRFFFLLPFGKI